jgi:ribonuclease G
MMPEFLPRLHFHRTQGDFGLADVLGFAALEEQLQQRRVRLEQGGSIILDPCEALTVIDVNSGHDTRGHDGRALRLRTNLQAACEIARQLRLRNIGGMVVIDFLRMKSPEDRQQVDVCLRALLDRDRASCKVHGFTAMGLFELMRTPH